MFLLQLPRFDLSKMWKILEILKWQKKAIMQYMSFLCIIVWKL